MAFSEAEKVDIRRFAGFPPLGTSGVPATVEALNLEVVLAGMTAAEEAMVRTYLGRLVTLETVYFSALETVDTKQAAVWHRNPNALADAMAGLNAWRGQLAAILGIPLGPWGWMCGPALPAIFTV